MLETLRIQNYALIDELEIEFASGFAVLTGETGAGKSIIVDALDLVLGTRASSGMVRQGADKAKVDALFHIQRPVRRLQRLLKEHEIELENGRILLSRIVTADGRSRAYAGGNLIPVTVLEAIGNELVDLHGQHEHQSLLKPDRQLGLVDGFAGTEKDASDVAEQVSRLRELERAIAELESDDRERERRLEFLRFEVGEIDAADLKPGEEEELKARHNLITNAERIVTLTSEVYAALYEGERGAAAIDCVDAALHALGELARIDGRFQAITAQLSGARSEIEEASREIHGYTEGIDFDPDELDSLNRRLALIGTLRRKYGDSIEAILQYRDNAALELDRFERRDQHLAEMQAERTSLLEKAQRDAQELSRKRRAAARKLDKQVTANLQELGMQGGRFETRFEAVALGLDGIDRLEFLLSANPGEKPKPLRQVASGGEISRVMLALKTVFAHADQVPTLIFDEIDAGVGGAMAGKVAAQLRDLADSHQTICITHLPQIAAAARTHYHVGKTESGGRTVTTIARLEGKSRVDEIAQLLDGSVSEVSLQHARALLGEEKAGRRTR